jgi:hypothetical protein
MMVPSFDRAIGMPGNAERRALARSCVEVVHDL